MKMIFISVWFIIVIFNNAMLIKGKNIHSMEVFDPRQISAGPLNILWPNPLAIIVQFFSFLVSLVVGSTPSPSPNTTTTTTTTSTTTTSKYKKFILFKRRYNNYKDHS